jgi:hypothetical protein
MTDQYQAFTQSPIGKFVVKNLGLPSPVVLERFESAQPVVNGAVLVAQRRQVYCLVRLHKYLAIFMQIAM